MNLVRTLGAALLVPLLALAADRLAAQETTVPFVVGVWAENDTILPFADFDGQRWRTNWNQRIDIRVTLPSLQEIPATWWGRAVFAPTWEAVQPGGRRRDVRIVGTAMTTLGSECAMNVGLEADVPKGTYQYGSALAASRPGVVATISALTPASADWHTVSRLLPGLYQRHEALAWQEVPEDSRPNMTGHVPQPRLDAVFTSDDGRGQYVYFESYRVFARRADQLGDERSFISGWLWRRSPSLPFQAITIRADTMDADGKGAHTFHPLGVVSHGARRFWLGYLGSYAYSAMAVLDVRRGGIEQVAIAEYPGC